MRMRTVLAICALGLLAVTASASEDLRFFRIGTGGVAGTYYPIGGLIASIISNPPGSRPCEKGGSCGVPSLIATAQSSNGSVANVEAIASGTLDSGFAQSDIAFWAYSGAGIFEDREPVANLRAIASLYPESFHLVARKGAGIETVRDLAGKRVSLDEEGSGTLVDARIILDAFGVDQKQIDVHHIKPSLAIGMIENDELDAFILVAGYPAISVTELAGMADIDLVSIEGPEIERLIERHEFFAKDVIPGGVYDGIGETSTLSVGAQWVIAEEVDDELVYAMTKALWHESARSLLEDGHAQARSITLSTALEGLAIPLHPGAARYYQEIGHLKDES